MNDNNEESVLNEGGEVAPSSTQLYSLPPEQSAAEVAQGYAYQEWLIDQRVGTASVTKWLGKALGLLGTTLGTAGDILSMESSSPSAVSQTLVFRNDADIIIIPHGGIGMPTGHQFSESPGAIFPGEVATLRIAFNSQFAAPAGAAQIIRFAIITTDSQIIARRPVDQIRALNVQLTFSRDGRLHISNVNIGGSLAVPRTNSQYIGYRGSSNTTLPSFGICVTTVAPATQSGHVMGTTVTFTPLGLRS
ncbi:putative Major capsid protein VP1 [Pseudomonas soli]